MKQYHGDCAKLAERMGEEMERTIPDAGLVVFENGTHFAYLEQYPRFITVVRQFLTGRE